MGTPVGWICGLRDAPVIGGLAAGEHGGDARKTMIAEPQLRAGWNLIGATGTAEAPAEASVIADIGDLGRIGQAFTKEGNDLPSCFLSEAQEACLDILLAGGEDRRDRLHLSDEHNDPRTVGEIAIKDRNITQGKTQVLNKRGRIPL